MPSTPARAEPRWPRWPGWAVLAGTGAAGALVVFALLRYPDNLDDPGAPRYLAVLVALLALYLGLAGWAARRPRPGRELGTLVGLVGGGLWSIEIWAGGPAMLDRSTETAVGGTFALLAVAVTVAAGPLAAIRRRDAGAALRSGLFAGLTSGVVVFCLGTVMTLANLDLLGTRTDYQREFAASHAPDIATYLVGDVLAATIAHLVINLVLGLVGGGVGALMARSAQPRDAVTPS